MLATQIVPWVNRRVACLVTWLLFDFLLLTIIHLSQNAHRTWSLEIIDALRKQYYAHSLCPDALVWCSGRPAPSGASWLRAAARTRLQGGGGRGRKERRREKYFLNSMNGLEQGREHMMGKGMKHSMWAEWRQHLKHILRHKTLESLLAQLLFTWRKPVASLLVCAGGSGGWWVRGSGRHSEAILQIFNFWSFELFHWIFGMFWNWLVIMFHFLRHHLNKTFKMQKNIFSLLHFRVLLVRGKALWLPGTGREIENPIPVLREGNGN